MFYIIKIDNRPCSVRFISDKPIVSFFACRRHIFLIFCMQVPYFFHVLRTIAIIFSCFANDCNYFFKFSVRDNRKNFLIRNSNHKKICHFSCIFRALVLKYTRGDIDEEVIHWQDQGCI